MFKLILLVDYSFLSALEALILKGQTKFAAGDILRKINFFCLWFDIPCELSASGYQAPIER